MLLGCGRRTARGSTPSTCPAGRPPPPVGPRGGKSEAGGLLWWVPRREPVPGPLWGAVPFGTPTRAPWVGEGGTQAAGPRAGQWGGALGAPGEGVRRAAIPAP